MSEQSTPAPVPPQEQVEYRDLAALDLPGYRVGDDGSVWTCREKVQYGNVKADGPTVRLSETWRRIRPTSDRTGYLRVRLYRGAKRKRFLVHRLVLLAFVGPCPAGMNCRHFPDRDRTNNRLANVSWATVKVNLADRIVHGTMPRGEASGKATLTEKKVFKILELIAGGMRLCEISRTLSVSWANIYKVKTGRAWGWLTGKANPDA